MLSRRCMSSEFGPKVLLRRTPPPSPSTPLSFPICKESSGFTRYFFERNSSENRFASPLIIVSHFELNDLCVFPPRRSSPPDFFPSSLLLTKRNSLLSTIGRSIALSPSGPTGVLIQFHAQFDCFFSSSGPLGLVSLPAVNICLIPLIPAMECIRAVYFFSSLWIHSREVSQARRPLSRSPGGLRYFLSGVFAPPLCRSRCANGFQYTPVSSMEVNPSAFQAGPIRTLLSFQVSEPPCDRTCFQ